MALIDDLTAQARREKRLIDAITEDFAEDLDRVVTQINRQIRRLLARLDNSDGKLIAERASLGRALALRAEITTAMDAAGFGDLVTRAFDLDDLAILTLKGNGIAARAARQTPIDPNIVTALQELREADLLAMGEQAADAFWRAALDGVIGSRDLADLVDDMADLADVTKRQARTLHDTAVSTYSRQVRQLGLPGEPDDRFLYMGPFDGRTRPFCRNLIGEVHTREEISRMSNGQIAGVLLTGGGYNCRHTFQFIGSSTVEDLGGTSTPAQQELGV